MDERLGRGTRNEGNGNVKTTDKRKAAVYFPGNMIDDISAQAARLDRSVSWVLQRAWKLAQSEIAAMPGVDASAGDDDTPGE